MTVYRKALFRDRNQPIKQELFTLEPRPDALRVSSSRSIGAIHAKRLKLSNLGSFEPDNSDTFVSSPLFRSGQQSPRPLNQSVAAGERAVYVTVTLEGSGQGSASPEVTLQVLGPDPRAASDVAVISC